ncbi:MAG: RagB/SusD family nutrient uptake outer membrane protein, partial [Bacteroidales bacterium]|nr:RagB/SusD family nutrient uptake outer membrane protein [Bacteroidales bacterium]
IFDADGNSTGTVANGTIPYEFTRKYVDPEYTGDKSSTRPYLIRFSDVQLIYAEATADAGGLAEYNAIRRRAGVSELTDLGSLTKDEFRSLVIEERQRELAFEGDRLWDLRRKNMVQDKVTEAAGLTPEQLAFYPLPQREIDLNPNIN